MGLMPFARILRNHAAAAPDRPMITCKDRMITRQQLDLESNRLARAFAELGVVQDSFVTIALPNSIDFYLAACATLKLGATPQPVSAKLPLAEQQAIVDLAKPALIVGGNTDIATDAPCLPIGYAPPPHLSDAPLPERVARAWRAPTSGGSTGRPKLIVAGQPAEFDPDAYFMEMQHDQTQLVAGPLYHNAPFSMSMYGLTRGHHLVVMERFDAEEALMLIERHRANWLLLVPTMMSRIWRLGDAVRARYDLSSIETVWHMAAPCPRWLKEAWIEWLGPEKIWELYGGTEGQGVTIVRGDTWLARPGTVGKPLEVFEMIAVDDAGQPLPPGEVGEIFMRPKAGQGTTYRYIGAEPKTMAGGFESLGDIGWLDEDGYLYLADRRTDMILAGGANIYPAEVESVLDQHPAVRSSAVIGLPDDDLGNRVHAIVDATEPVSADELIAFVAERLVRYKVPRSIEFVSEPLRDDAGKVRRSELRRVRVDVGA
jgi:bile acid-coenzyme A ligase